MLIRVLLKNGKMESLINLDDNIKLKEVLKMAEIDKSKKDLEITIKEIVNNGN